MFIIIVLIVGELNIKKEDDPKIKFINVSNVELYTIVEKKLISKEILSNDREGQNLG